MSASLVGSEMCIRDSQNSAPRQGPKMRGLSAADAPTSNFRDHEKQIPPCLLYTSDAADDM
eukprot:538516-Alexandrium_andersonii.AAC.1